MLVIVVLFMDIVCWFVAVFFWLDIWVVQGCALYVWLITDELIGEIIPIDLSVYIMSAPAFVWSVIANKFYSQHNYYQ